MNAKAQQVLDELCRRFRHAGGDPTNNANPLIDARVDDLAVALKQSLSKAEVAGCSGRAGAGVLRHEAPARTLHPDTGRGPARNPALIVATGPLPERSSSARGVPDGCDLDDRRRLVDRVVKVVAGSHGERRLDDRSQLATRRETGRGSW